MSIKYLQKWNSDYPYKLSAFLGEKAPEQLAISGPELLNNKILGIVCSVECPGTVIMEGYHFFKKLSRCTVTILSGFHSPMEKECLMSLNYGIATAIWCLAKPLELFKLSKAFEPMLITDRIAFLSPFDEKVLRITKDSSVYCNLTVAALSDELFIPYAKQKGKCAKLAEQALNWSKLIFTLDVPENKWLINAGAQVIEETLIESYWPISQQLDDNIF